MTKSSHSERLNSKLGYLLTRINNDEKNRLRNNTSDHRSLKIAGGGLYHIGHLR